MQTKPTTPSSPSSASSSASSLSVEQQERVAEILTGFGVPPEKQEEYIAVLMGHLEVALDGYLSRFERLG